MRSCTPSRRSAAFPFRPPSGRCCGPRAPGGRDAVDARPIDAPPHRSYVAAMTDTLMVGVSGVRGIVGEDLTPEVVRRWAAAFGSWVSEGTGDGGPGRGLSDRPTVRPSVVVGRDSRESGAAFAKAVAEGLRAVGCDVIGVGLVPTPTVQLAVEHHH